MPATRSLAPAKHTRNRGFVKRANAFVNRVALLPGFPVLPLTGIAATVLMVVVGAFGTGEMPLMQRAGFWAVLIGMNVLIWQMWLAWLVRTPRDWTKAAAIGAVVINLPLPLEIPLVLRLFGIRADLDPSRTWIEALAISAVIFGAIFAIRRRQQREAVTPVAAPHIAPDGLLARAGLRTPDALYAIEAEDHYCRLHLADGRSVLVHYRFGDALAEVAGFDGAQVHRGAWVANAGVAGARREARRWSILLPGGAALPVSAGFAQAARARGWLRPLR